MLDGSEDELAAKRTRVLAARKSICHQGETVKSHTSFLSFIIHSYLGMMIDLGRDASYRPGPGLTMSHCSAAMIVCAVDYFGVVRMFGTMSVPISLMK